MTEFCPTNPTCFPLSDAALIYGVQFIVLFWIFDASLIERVGMSMGLPVQRVRRRRIISVDTIMLAYACLLGAG